MRDYKPHKKISRTNNDPSVQRITGINWIDNRPQTLAQAHLSAAIQRQIQVGGTTYSIDKYSARDFRSMTIGKRSQARYGIKVY